MHHLDKIGEMLGARLASIHNLHYYQQLMQSIRSALDEERFEEFIQQFYAEQAMGVDALDVA